MLQGTLDVFSLDDVLGLLSGAGKTGVLSVVGDRGTGSVALRDGHLTHGEAELASGDVTITSVAFELLRFREGSFTFEARSDVAGDDPQDLKTIMAAAHGRLSEWRSIEAVVPSLRHMLRLAPHLGGSDVTIDEAEWAAIVAVGEGNTVGATSERLGLGEVDGSRQVKGLIERGLLVLSEPEYEPASELPMRTSVVELPVFELPVAEPIDELAEYVTLDSPDQWEAEQVIVDAPVPAEPVLEEPVDEVPVPADPVLDEAAASFDETMFAPEAPEEIDAAAAAGLVDDIAEPDPFARRVDDVAAPAEAAPEISAEVPFELSEGVRAELEADSGAEGSLLMRYLKSNG